MSTYQPCGLEPSLEEVLGDPMIHLLMARDRVREEDLLHLASIVRRLRPQPARDDRQACCA